MAKKSIFITGNTKGSHDNVTIRYYTIANKVKEDLKGTKVAIVLPTVLYEPSANWNDSIRSDISTLMGCDELHMMVHWQGHKRSEILRDIAIRIGIHVVYH